MADYRPIPIPLRQRWRRFRTRQMPILVFLAAVLAAASIWRTQSTPSTLVGEVYAPFSPVLAPLDGFLEDLEMQPHKEYRAGEIIGHVRSVPADQARAQIEALRAEIAMIRIGAGDPVLNQQRNQLNWQSLRRDWMLARSDLASLEVMKRQAEADLRRLDDLAKRGAESQSIYEQGRALFDSLSAQEQEKRRLVTDLESAVRESNAFTGQDSPTLADGLKAALDWKEAELKSLEASLEPLPLVAPYDGRITMIYHHNGAFIKLGEPIAEFRAIRPDYIIGYIKMPYPADIRVGMQVEVSQRSSRPTSATANLLSIGPQFEALGLAFQRPMPVQMEERALPVLISLPENLRLKPGEIVDLRLREPEA